MINVLVNGANGRMGKEAVLALESDSRFTLVGIAVHGDDLAKTIQSTKPQVVVDLTLPDCVFDNAKTIINSGVSPIIGTSGLVEAQIAELSHLCEAKKLGGMIVPNFSLSAVLMMLLSKMAANYFPYVEIIEAHHEKKVDSPSGTAMKTAKIISEARDKPIKAPNADTAARGEIHYDIPIHSIRTAGVVADQDVIFGGEDETLTIKSRTLSRKAFMPGLLMCCEKVVSLDRLVYGLEEILK